jgi:arylsulfatase A-like enzyme
MSDAKEKLDDLGILPDTILVIVNDNGKFIELENDSNGFVVYHKDDKELKKVQKLLGDL